MEFATPIRCSANIIAAASDFDALLNGALSETHHSLERARQMLRGGIGARYDCDVVEALTQALAAAEVAACAEVEIDVRDLRSGMVLARDLVSPRGAILLAAGYVLDERTIRQVCEFGKRDGIGLALRVRREGADGAPLPPGQAPRLAA